MCNERGGVIDDLYAYCVAKDEFLLIVNASRIEADVAWIERQLAAWAQTVKMAGGTPALPGFENASERFGAVALQGPRAAQFIDACFPGASLSGTPAAHANELIKNQLGIFNFEGSQIYLARTGYTGEDGFEAIAPAAVIEAVWNKILAVGHAHCLQPAGLGARDTLRTEVCYPLYGHELDEQTTPIEAGVGSFVALDKGEFIGRAVLAGQKANGVTKKCVAFKMGEKAPPPRPHYPIWSSGADASHVGEVVTGTQSPSLGIGIGMGYVPPALAKPGTNIEIEIRGKRAPALIVPKPIYRKSS
jgi:aminomethyltransferase